MSSIEEAQKRWQSIRARGRTKGIIVLVAAVAVVLLLSVVAGSNAGLIVGIVCAVLLVAFLVVMFVSQRRTGLSITPEWAPKEGPNRFDDDDDFDDADVPAAAVEPGEAVDGEPVRAVDGQMLGTDLAALGQAVSPKLAKSYALGTISIAEGELSWTPSTVSAGQGVQPLSIAASSLAGVERAPLWGSWALLRVAPRVGADWVFRVPSSVDLAPACAEAGIAFRSGEPKA